MCLVKYVFATMKQEGFEHPIHEAIQTYLGYKSDKKREAWFRRTYLPEKEKQRKISRKANFIAIGLLLGGGLLEGATASFVGTSSPKSPSCTPASFRRIEKLDCPLTPTPSPTQRKRAESVVISYPLDRR